MDPAQAPLTAVTLVLENIQINGHYFRISAGHVNVRLQLHTVSGQTHGWCFELQMKLCVFSNV